MIQMARCVSFRGGEHGGGGCLPIAVPTGEDEDGQRFSFHFLPLNRRDLSADQFRVVLPFVFARLAHE